MMQGAIRFRFNSNYFTFAGKHKICAIQKIFTILYQIF